MTVSGIFVRVLAGFACVAAVCHAACLLPALQTDCVGLTTLSLTPDDLIAACSLVPSCSTAVWGSGALVPDLGIAVISQNLALLDGVGAISAICPAVIALAANVSTCVPTNSLLAAQAVVFGDAVRAAQLCGSGQRAEFLPATGTIRCYCPAGQLCNPVHPSEMAFQVSMIIFAFILVLFGAGIVAQRDDESQKQ